MNFTEGAYYSSFFYAFLAHGMGMVVGSSVCGKMDPYHGTHTVRPMLERNWSHRFGVLCHTPAPLSVTLDRFCHKLWVFPYFVQSIHLFGTNMYCSYCNFCTINNLKKASLHLCNQAQIEHRLKECRQSCTEVKSYNESSAWKRIFTST